MRIGITAAAGEMTREIEAQLPVCAVQASNELRNAALEVLRGQRDGKRYNTPASGRVTYNKRSKTAKITYRKYSASSPGEPPAVRTGILRNSWRPVQSGNNPALESNVLYAGFLEGGTKKMEPRPFAGKIVEKAMPKIERVYRAMFGMPR